MVFSCSLPTLSNKQLDVEGSIPMQYPIICALAINLVDFSAFYKSFLSPMSREKY